MASLEEVSGYTLDDAGREQLLAQQRVCAVCWTTKDGWPVGVTHRYVWEGGCIWVTTSAQRHRVKALRQRPKSCVIISGDGTELGPDRTLTLKTECTVHEDRNTLTWRRASITWRCCTKPKADTAKPRRCTSARWRSGRRSMGPRTRM